MLYLVLSVISLLKASKNEIISYVSNLFDPFLQYYVRNLDFLRKKGVFEIFVIVSYCLLKTD